MEYYNDDPNRPYFTFRENLKFAAILFVIVFTVATLFGWVVELTQGDEYGFAEGYIWKMPIFLIIVLLMSFGLNYGMHKLRIYYDKKAEEHFENYMKRKYPPN